MIISPRRGVGVGNTDRWYSVDADSYLGCQPSRGSARRYGCRRCTPTTKLSIPSLPSCAKHSAWRRQVRTGAAIPTQTPPQPRFALRPPPHPVSLSSQPIPSHPTHPTPRHTTPRNTTQHKTVQRNTAQHSTTRRHTTQSHLILSQSSPDFTRRPPAPAASSNQLARGTTHSAAAGFRTSAARRTRRHEPGDSDTLGLDWG